MVRHREIEVSDRHRQPPKKDKICLLDNLCGQESVNLREVELETGVRIKKSGFHSQLLWDSVKDQDLTEHTNFACERSPKTPGNAQRDQRSGAGKEV